MKIQTKLNVLERIAERFHAARITWAVGGSMLLYFKGIVPVFRDIDILVKTEEAETVREILAELGTQQTSARSDTYRSEAFFEFNIDGVDVDVIAGFVIVRNGVPCDRSLRDDEITESVRSGNETIPLHSLAVWRRNYELMDQPEKVRLIDDSLG
ncbi:MAG: hypothetical protein IH607_04115 [Firmicutes bacterium]|nr:hypothetical protein [Bacillota bacterium]